jgi:Secretion system C-terminal sorting domain/G8 domain
MKHFYNSPLFVSFLLISQLNYAAQISLAQNNVNWNSTNSWNPGRIPATGDTVIIPAGKNVFVSNNVYNNTPNLYIKVSGSITFQPSGKLDLGVNSTVEILAGGSIISNNTGSERILIGGSLKYKGNNDGTITGYALANSSTPSSGSGAGSGFITTPLVISLKYFQAIKMNNKVQINWHTSYEREADYFEVQRSENQQDWKPVYTIKAFNLTQGNSYNYTDADALRRDVFYRLKSVQKNGAVEFSSTALVKFKEIKSTISIYPNPTTDYTIISLNDIFEKGTIKLAAFDGQPVLTKTFTRSSGFIKLELKDLPRGTYIVEIKDNHNNIQTEKIIRR